MSLRTVLFPLICGCLLWFPLTGLLSTAAARAAALPEDSALQQALNTILAVEAGSTADAPTAQAWRVVAAAGIGDLPVVLAAVDKATPLAANWLSTAIDRIVEEHLAGGGPLPQEVLREFVLDASHSLTARKTAMDLLARSDPQAIESLQARLLEDPEAELRRPAIEEAIQRASAMADDVPEDQRREAWGKLLTVARDPGQVRVIAKGLEPLGVTVDLAAHFGYLTDWYIIGPFDNSESKGFDATYPPESLQIQDTLDLAELLDAEPIRGKTDLVRWKRVTAQPSNGDVDLNKEIEKLRDVCAYGATVFHSPREQRVEVRLRLQNSFKIWLNGKLLKAQPVGHTGNSFDQYIVEATLREGANLILVKSCQVNIRGNSGFYDVWHFSVRVSDSTGGAILSSDRTPATKDN